MYLDGKSHADHAEATSEATSDATSEATAEAQALIEEARARTRRRRRRIGVTVICAAVFATGALAVAGDIPGVRSATGAPDNGPAGADSGSPPRYFLYAQQTGGGYDWLQIRDSATGKLVTNPRFPKAPHGDIYDPPYGLAATGPGSFVVGMMADDDCATRFFQFRLNDHGQPSALTPVGPLLPGDLTAIATSAGGGLIGYAIADDGCPNAGPKQGYYAGVLNVQTGQTRQWTNGFAISQMSMSANGQLLAFTRTLEKPMGRGSFMITGEQVLTLPTNAPPGGLTAASHVVVRMPPDDSLFGGGSAVQLSPSGTSFYLCSPGNGMPRPYATRYTESARIVEYQTATGKPTGVTASFATTYVVPRSSKHGYYPPALGCSSMALDSSGRYLLVPYLVTPLSQTDTSGALLRTAVINTATHARSTWTLRFGQGTAPSTITLAW
jgi:hypothetical protein